jgi:hypothetical protein
MDGFRDRLGVEPVVRQHFGVGAAGGNLRQADRPDIDASAAAIITPWPSVM